MAGNYKQLKAQIAKLEEEAAALRKLESAEAVATIKALIDEFDLTAEDLGFKAGRKPVAKGKSAGAPKYRDPETGKTWTGRGKPPAWIAAAAKAGTADAFLIEKAAPSAPAAPAAKRRTRAAKAEAAPAAAETPVAKKRGGRAAAKKTTEKAAAKPKAPRRPRKKAVEVAPADAGSAPAMESLG